MPLRHRFLAPIFCALAVACSSDDDSGGGGGAAGAGGSGECSTDVEPDLSPLGGERPVTPVVSSNYCEGRPAPLLITLHGFGAGGLVQETTIFGFTDVLDERGWIYLYPDGTRNAMGTRFWNATDACCGFGSDVDDVAYISGLIEEAKQRFSIDDKRVYLAGHSNGGFMSYRMACDRADLIAGIASLAGSTWGDASKCNPSEPVAVLQMHGTDDGTIAYDGNDIGGAAYPSAPETVERWAQRGGCAAEPTDADPVDYTTDIPGAEGRVSRYVDCDPGGGAELWTLDGVGHIPALSDEASARVIDFFDSHPKP